MQRAFRAARTFATYTTIAGAVGVGSFLAYHRKAQFVDFPLGQDPIFRSAAYTKFKNGFAALGRLTELCASLPVHCIFGEAIDMV